MSVVVFVLYIIVQLYLHACLCTHLLSRLQIYMYILLVLSLYLVLVFKPLVYSIFVITFSCVHHREVLCSSLSRNLRFLQKALRFLGIPRKPAVLQNGALSIESPALSQSGVAAPFAGRKRYFCRNSCITFFNNHISIVTIRGVQIKCFTFFNNHYRVRNDINRISTKSTITCI